MITLRKEFISFKTESGREVQCDLCEIYGLSTDTKPTSGIAEGSTFLEENTGKVFIMKADGNWVEL